MCDGLPEAPVTNLVVENVTIVGQLGQTCLHCFGTQNGTNPKLCMQGVTGGVPSIHGGVPSMQDRVNALA